MDSDSALKNGNSILINAKQGSIIVQHPLIIHRSFYPSKGHPTRITAILRIDDAGDKDHLNLGLKTALGGSNIFNSPEYIKYYQNHCSQNN